MVGQMQVCSIPSCAGSLSYLAFKFCFPSFAVTPSSWWDTASKLDIDQAAILIHQDQARYPDTYL